MGYKRDLLEAMVAVYRRFAKIHEFKNPPSILVLRNNDLGDVLVITPLLEALRRAYPNSRIDIAVGNWARPVLEGLPFVDNVVTCNAPWYNRFTGNRSLGKVLKYIWDSEEVKQLRSNRYDIGIDVLGSTFGSLLFLRLGMPVRLSSDGYAGGISGATAHLDSSFVGSVAAGSLRFLELLGVAPQPAVSLRPTIGLSMSERLWAESFWAENFLAPDLPRIVLVPGAGDPVKEWSAESFAKLAEGFAHSANLVVLGSEKEFSAGESIVASSPAAINLSGKLKLRQSIALVSAAHIVVCNSTLMMHVASAFDVPCVVILTPALPADIHYRLWCSADVHTQLAPNGDGVVSVEEVSTSVRKLLFGQGRTS